MGGKTLLSTDITGRRRPCAGLLKRENKTPSATTLPTYHDVFTRARYSLTNPQTLS